MFLESKERLSFVHFAFNLSQVSLAITAAYWTYVVLFNHVVSLASSVALLVAAIITSVE